MFPSNRRVKKDNIKDIINKGKKIYSESFLIKRKENNINHNRFAVVVSKKISKRAIARNLIKRRFTNAIKKNLENSIDDNDVFYDYVFIVSPKQDEFNYQKIYKEIGKTLF